MTEYKETVREAKALALKMAKLLQKDLAMDADQIGWMDVDLAESRLAALQEAMVYFGGE